MAEDKPVPHISNSVSLDATKHKMNFKHFHTVWKLQENSLALITNECQENYTIKEFSIEEKGKSDMPRTIITY